MVLLIPYVETQNHRMVSKSKKNMQEVFHKVREEELQFQLKKL